MKLIEKIILVIYSIIMLILSLIFCLLIFRWADINLVQNSIMNVLNNLTIKNNRFYKSPVIFTSVSGVVLIENNIRITENDEVKTNNTFVVEFNKHANQTQFDDNYAQIIFVNN